MSPASQCGQSARGVQPRDRSGGIFRDFDDLAHRHGLEKIKTIGAAYMAAGLPVPEADHVDRAVQMGPGHGGRDRAAASGDWRLLNVRSGLADERVSADAHLQCRELPPDQVERVDVDEDSSSHPSPQ